MSCKYKRLHRVWSRCNVDLINLAKIKINLVLLSKDKDIRENLFWSKVNHTIFANNSNKLIGMRQQGRVLSSVRGDLVQFSAGSGVDSSNLSYYT